MTTEQEALEIARTCRVVAVVGMTDGSKPGRASFEIPQMLQSHGIRVLPVNPMISGALGETAVGRLSELIVTPDLVDVFRRPEAIPELADELLALAPERRPATVWLQTGVTHPDSEARLEAAGFRVVSDRCLGVWVARSGR